MPIRLTRMLFALLAGTLLAMRFGPVLAEDDAGPAAQAQTAIMLVAKPDVTDPFYANTVLIVRPLEGGGHAGFVLNKPTRVSLGQAFPDDEPSQKVHQPVYLGGPVNPNVIFALVKREGSPGDGAVEFAPGLYLAVSGDSVDHVIQQEPDQARFLAGAVLWRPGELDEELKMGAWYVMDADTNAALDNPAQLWEKLVQRAQKHARVL